MTRKQQGEGVVTVKGETYYTVERAAEYIGRKRAAMFNYIKRYNLETHKFPLQGKRIFLRKSDLDKLLSGELNGAAA